MASYADVAELIRAARYAEYVVQNYPPDSDRFRQALDNLRAATDRAAGVPPHQDAESGWVIGLLVILVVLAIAAIVALSAWSS